MLRSFQHTNKRKREKISSSIVIGKTFQVVINLMDFRCHFHDKFCLFGDCHRRNETFLVSESLRLFDSFFSVTP